MRRCILNGFNAYATFSIQQRWKFVETISERLFGAIFLYLFFLPVKLILYSEKFHEILLKLTYFIILACFYAIFM
eukprot:UN24789